MSEGSPGGQPHSNGLGFLSPSSAFPSREVELPRLRQTGSSQREAPKAAVVLVPRGCRATACSGRESVEGDLRTSPADPVEGPQKKWAAKPGGPRSHESISSLCPLPQAGATWTVPGQQAQPPGHGSGSGAFSPKRPGKWGTHREATALPTPNSRRAITCRHHFSWKATEFFQEPGNL